MKIKKELYPKVGVLSTGIHYVYLWYQGKRYRYSNGSAIEQNIYPNHLPKDLRLNEAQMLCAAFTLAVRNGWRPEVLKTSSNSVLRISELASTVLERKLALDYSKAYKADLKRTARLWEKYIYDTGIQNKPVGFLSTDILADFIFKSAYSPQSKRNLKRNISSLLKDELESSGVVINLKRIKLPKKGQELHKPIRNVAALLKEIESFNSNLHLCSLMTYTMLLRPHREIRCLRFEDFNSDFTQLSLSGDRVKSKRNRILPVPQLVREKIKSRFEEAKGLQSNVFSLQDYQYHGDYFKGLWSKYKAKSTLLGPDQTLYSFRHTGALRVFEKTGSLQKLQQVMGHSDMKVSLTYLRGLEVQQLDVNDLPEF